MSRWGELYLAAPSWRLRALRALLAVLIPCSSALAERLFWTSTYQRELVTAEFDGQNISALLPTTDRPYGIALDRTIGKVYWTSNDDAVIRRANLDGTDVQVVCSSGLSAPAGIAIDAAGGHVYWTDQLAARIQRSSLDGSDIVTLVGSGLSVPLGIALDVGAGKMYWVDYGTAKVQRANLDGTQIEDLVNTGIGFAAIALDLYHGKVYWGSGSIQRANLDGGNLETVVGGGGVVLEATAIALDVPNDKLYWTRSVAGSIQVRRNDLNGANPTLVCSAPGRTSGIALLMRPGDANRNGVIDLSDLAEFTDCMTGPNTPPAPFVATDALCDLVFDLDADGDVDMVDYTALLVAARQP